MMMRNMKTAQALGLTFPDEIMLQITEVHKGLPGFAPRSGPLRRSTGHLVGAGGRVPPPHGRYAEGGSITPRISGTHKSSNAYSLGRLKARATPWRRV
jgi:hypothetical protein